MKNNWEKDLHHDPHFTFDEVYHKLDSNKKLQKRLRIVHYPGNPNPTVFYSEKIDSWIDPDTGETFIETKDEEFTMLTYEEAKSKFFYEADLEALEIINSVEDFY